MLVELITKIENYVECPGELCENIISVKPEKDIGIPFKCSWCGTEITVTKKQVTIEELLQDNDSLENMPDEEYHKLLFGISNLTNKAYELISKIEAKTNVPEMEIHVKSGSSHS